MRTTEERVWRVGEIPPLDSVSSERPRPDLKWLKEISRVRIAYHGEYLTNPNCTDLGGVSV